MVAPTVSAENGRHDKPGADEAVALQIAKELIDSKHPMNIESLLDAIVAIHHDCNVPGLTRIRNVQMFLEKFGPLVRTLISNRMKTADFRMIKVIGRGAYGEVQLVRHTRNQKVFAMKRLEKAEMIRRYDVSFFWEERNIMAHANSDWIVKMFYSFQDQRYLYMVMEFMPGGDLVNLMSREDIPEEWARFYIAELVLALDAIHSLGYIHRDVKPDNMLISSTGHVKLADFGTCVKLNPEGKIKCATAAGTPDYISPEVLNSQCSESVYGVEVDYWSVGIILFEMLFGEPPFYADTLVKTYSRIQNFKDELKFPSEVPVSKETKDIINKFLSAANVRLGRNGSAEVREHSFFKNDNWNFDNICQATPPFIPALITDDDTSNFEDIDQPDQVPVDSFQMSQAFNGSQLAFIGFTYSNEFNPALALSLSNGVNKNVVPQLAIEMHEQVEVNVQETAVVNGNGGHMLNGIHEPIVNGVSEQIKIDIVKEQAIVDESMQMLINDKQDEIWSLKEKRTRLEASIQKLQSDKALLEARFNTLREEHSTAQSLVEVYKAELDELRNKYFENDRELTNFNVVLESLHEVENKLRSEQIARRIADQNVAELDKEKAIMKAELKELIERRSQDVSIINKQRQREAELVEALNKAREEATRVSGHGSRPSTGPVIHHHSERSSDSASLNMNMSGSRASLHHDLEGMTYEQLYQRCQREIAMKNNAVEKLLIMGTNKGIENEKALSRSKSTKKQRADLNRQRELWERDQAVERQRMRESEKEKEKEVEFYRGQVQDMMIKHAHVTQANHDLENQLKALKAVAGPELTKCLMNGIAAGHVQSKKKRVYR